MDWGIRGRKLGFLRDSGTQEDLETWFSRTHLGVLVLYSMMAGEEGVAWPMIGDSDQPPATAASGVRNRVASIGCGGMDCGAMWGSQDRGCGHSSQCTGFLHARRAERTLFVVATSGGGFTCFELKNAGEDTYAKSHWLFGRAFWLTI